MTQFTEFGKQVKIELIKKNQSMAWLQEEVAGRTGLYMDSAYMSRILSGKRSPQKVVTAICEILDLSIPQPETDKQDRG